MTIARAIARETEVARTLLANIADILGADEEMKVDAIAGETDLLEAIAAAVERISECTRHGEAIDAQVAKLKERQGRFERQGEHLRAAVLAAMEQANLKSLELPAATLTRKQVAPKAIITNESDVPSRFWIPSNPKLDKKAVLEALKAKEDVPGATLSNAGETLQLRFG